MNIVHSAHPDKSPIGMLLKSLSLKISNWLVGFKWVFPFSGGSKNKIFLYVYKYQFFKWKNFRKFHAFFPQTATREIARSSHITLQGGRVVDPFIHVQPRVVNEEKMHIWGFKFYENFHKRSPYVFTT